VAIAHQTSFCLGGIWVVCPLYKRARRKGIVHRRRLSRRQLFLALGLGFVALVLVVGFAVRLAEASATGELTAFVDLVRQASGAVTGTVVSEPSPPTSTIAGVTPAEALVGAAPATETEPPYGPTPTEMAPSTITSTPTVTPTATPSPTATRTSTRTATPSPTPTVTPTVTPSSTQPPTSTPKLTRRPTLTPTPDLRSTYPAPALTGPADGETFGGQAQVVLSWQAVGELREDEYYVVELAYNHKGAVWYDETPWLRETSWELSTHRYLHDLSSDGVYRWSVRVMRRTGADAAGRPVGEPLSPSSEMRTLVWQAPPRPTPAPPLP